MLGRRTKLRVLLSVVALAQVLTIPVTSGQAVELIPAAISIEFGHERVTPISIPREIHRKQRIKRASAERRAAEKISMMSHSNKIAAHSAA